MIGGKQADHSIGIAVQQNECRQPDGGRRVAPDGFGENLLLVESRKLAQRSRAADARS